MYLYWDYTTNMDNQENRKVTIIILWREMSFVVFRFCLRTFFDLWICVGGDFLVNCFLRATSVAFRIGCHRGTSNVGFVFLVVH